MFVFLALVLSAAAADSAEDEDFPHGLVAQYSVGEQSVERIDADVSFQWRSDSPDQRLPAGPFRAEWRGQLLVREQGEYTLSAYIQGEVRVRIEGADVLHGTLNEPGWVIGRPFSIGFGEKSLEVSFEKFEKAEKNAPDARIQLFWSSDRFPLEPIPPHALFHEGTNHDHALVDTGRQLFAAQRCNRCHRREHDPLGPPAPSLETVAAGLDPRWLVAKIQHSLPGDEESRMPSFGFSPDEALQIAAYLWKHSKKVDLTSPDKIKPDDSQKVHRQGEVLVRSAGCLACHRIGNLGTSGPFDGGDLSHVGRKRSAAWLQTWLERPDDLNVDHRMPVFRLTSSERGSLARMFSQLKGDGGGEPQSQMPEFTAELAAKGRKLIEAARCVACHRIPGIAAKADTLPDLSAQVIDWSRSCLNPDPDRKRQRPAYTEAGRDAIIAFVQSRSGQLNPESRFARGQRVLEQRNCLACHERDVGRGIVDVAGRAARLDNDLNGQSPTLIPPELTAVGDKLHDAALSDAVSGEQKTVRMPWLKVRMPRFQHDADDKAALVAYLIDHDRIPDQTPDRDAAVVKFSWDRLPACRVFNWIRQAGSLSHAFLNMLGAGESGSETDAQTLVAGHTLVGPKGLSCIACHQVADYEPRNVALGTRGSDLFLIGQRMRRPYFLRWTRSPIRIIPGMEMPSYTRPVPAVLDGRIESQLLAIWDALNDPRFKPPTNPSNVEQLLAVKSGEPPRIVRDVFTDAKENGGGFVPRAFAVGFGNGHSVLLDLDRFAVRQWTFGDFARQRSVGKSWYWDMAGVPVMSGFVRAADVALQPHGKSSAPLLFPKFQSESGPGLKGYESLPDGGGMRLNYELLFDIGRPTEADRGRPTQTLSVAETLAPMHADDGARNGWKRAIQVRGVPADYDVLIARPIATSTLGEPSIESPEPREWETPPQPEQPRNPRQYLRVAGPFADAGASVTLTYLCSLTRDKLELKSDVPPAPVAQQITSAPGFDGVRLPLDRSIMPTSITWTHDGVLAFTSLKGHVYLARDTNGDGVEDSLSVFEEGLAAPYGLIADRADLIVAHKPELLRLHDRNGDGRVDERTVFASGWGYNDDYHDWTCGIIRDSSANLYVGLGSDYAQKERPREQSRWRGCVLRISPGGQVTPVGHGFRYPTGLAVNSQGEIYVSDNQGVQNTFNEINRLRDGTHYGVPSLHEEHRDAEATNPAIQVPHPWTRSVNGLFFLPADFRIAELAGHGIGCEYNSRFLIRFTLQHVGDAVQGATYAFTLPDVNSDQNFLGPLCGAISSAGEIYVGSIHDSGWSGGLNVGEIVRLRPNGKLPNGIRELRATADGFEIHFLKPVDPAAARNTANYTISGYTRVWQGAYATPDSDRNRVKVKSAEVSGDARSVRLRVDPLRRGYVYDVTCAKIGIGPETTLWPDSGHYTMNSIPPAE